MKTRADIALGWCLVAGSLVPLGCGEPGRSIAPPSEKAIHDDAYLIPGYNPEAAKLLKKRGKAAQPTGEVIDLKNTRH